MSMSGSAVELPITTDATAEERLTSAARRSSCAGRTRRPSCPRPGPPGSRSLLAVLWTMPTFGLFVTSFRPPADIQTAGWWTFFANPGVTLRELPRTSWSERRRPRFSFFLQLVRHHAPRGDHPDQPGAAGGLRVRVDRVPGPRHPVRRGLRAADRADPGDADPAADASSSNFGPAETRSGRCGSRTRSSRCRWPSSCCTTS